MVLRTVRPLFVDGTNSFFHYTFGLCTWYYPFIFPLFCAYQFSDIFETNVWIDMTEFLIGVVIGFGLSKMANYIGHDFSGTSRDSDEYTLIVGNSGFPSEADAPPKTL